MLYRRDPETLDHLVIDGDRIIRLRTRVEALQVAHRIRQQSPPGTGQCLAAS